jgi:hypothetical protein
MYLDQLQNILNNNEIEESKKKEIFKDYYKKVERQISSKAGKEYNSDNYTKATFYQDLIKYNKFFEIFPSRFSNYKDPNDPDHKAYEEMLEKKWNDYKI